jgi:hypothetical protein
MPNPLKRKNSDVASVVSDALALIDKVAEFYAKYSPATVYRNDIKDTIN